MFKLCSNITIGGKKFTSVNEVKVNRSINTIGATASIKVPVSAVLKKADGTKTAIETAKEIKVGDPVLIRLGYNDILNDEFKGYVRRINYSTPLEIECEDAFFLARQKSVTISGASTTLRDCLEKCGFQVLHCIDLTIKNFVVDKRPVSWILGKLKTDYGLNIFFDMDEKIVAGRAFDVTSTTVKYELRKNVIKDDDLKYLQASDVKLKIKAICFTKDGTKVNASIGEDGGVEKTLHFYDIESVSELKILAEQELKKYSRDGYEGKIETFLLPYAEPCMLADLKDFTFSERNGLYHIEAVETTFGINGARRNVYIGISM